MALLNRIARKICVLVAVVAVVGGAYPVQAQQSCTTWSDFHSKATTEMLLQGMPSASEVELKAKLIHRTLMSDKEFDWVGFQLFAPENYLDNKRVDAAVYSVPFAVKINRQTQLDEEYIFNAPLKFEDQEKLKNIYKSFRILSPAKGADARRYQTLETDDIGQFEVEYQYTGPIHGSKSKLAYKKVGWTNKNTTFADVKDVVIHEDMLTFELGSCWLSKAVGQSDIEVLTEEQFLHLRVEQHNRLVLRQDKPSADARLLQLAKDPTTWDMLPFDEIYPPAVPNPMASGEQFVLALTSMEIRKLSHNELKKLLYDNQAYLHLLKAPLLKDVFSNEEQSRLILVLGLVDIPQSHALLTDIYLDEEFDYEARFRTLMALKYAEKPLDQELVDEIFSYASKEQVGSNNELAHSSMMVMGIISRNQAKSEFGRELSDRLALELTKSNREDGQAALLTALGNSGNTDHQDTITHYLGSESATLRERSAEALFHMPNEKALKSLSHSLVKEEISGTRQAILRSMGPNKFTNTEVKLVYDYAANSAEGDTRRAAISALVRQKEHDVDVKPQLKALMKKEKTEANLRDIMKALYSK